MTSSNCDVKKSSSERRSVLLFFVLIALALHITSIMLRLFGVINVAWRFIFVPELLAVMFVVIGIAAYAMAVIVNHFEGGD